jgi:hypothetical protein
MPSYIVKPKAGEDFYLRYSTIVDSPCESGTRADFMADGCDPDRLDRADEHGTSAMWGNPRVGGWADESFMVREGVEDLTKPEDAIYAMIARGDLHAFCETLQDDGYFHPPVGMLTWYVWPDKDADPIPATREGNR